MKKTVYHLAKRLGLFALSRRLMRRRLLILCYHGFEVADESGFIPGTFMRADTFERRLAQLRRSGHPVLPLPDAIERLQAGTLPDNAVCITLDDGFVSTGTIAAQALAKAGFPSTLYVTTYYVEKQVPIFNLVVQYMFWKTSRKQVELEGGDYGIEGRFDLTDPAIVQALRTAIIEHGNSRSAAMRERICRKLGLLLGIDYAAIVRDRRFSLMTPAELQHVERLGMDVQLHTHRHCLPAGDRSAAMREVLENARALQRMLGKECLHLCYPSGKWQPHQLEWLQELGIVSATTCDRGMNHANVHPLALYRFVDSEAVSDIEFEAELAGFAELLRILSGRQRRSARLRRLINAVGDPVGIPEPSRASAA